MTLEHSDIAAGACFPLFPRKRKVRPPGPEELRTWIKAFPVWERSSSYTWEADYSTLPQRVRGQVKEGSDERKQPFHDGRPAAARGVSSSPAQKPEEASTSSRPKSSSRVVDKSTEDIRIQRAAAAVTSSSFSVSALLSKSARTARHVKENGRQNASRNVSQGVTRNSGVQEVTAERSRKGAIEVIDLSEQVKRRRKSKGDGAASFDMSALFPKSRKTLELPEFVSDLSTREGLEAFEDEMKVGKDMAFSLLLGSKAYGSCPTSKWLNVHSTSSTPLSKEQKRELKVKVGTDFQHMDPDGHVVGMCFMFNGGANFKGEGTLHFLPLCQKEHSSIVVSGAVPLPQRIEVLQDFLNSKHCATCFDLQGILRRLYRCGISSGISSKSRLSCLKLMAWMLEPGLVHDKIIQEYSFKSISQLYQIEVVGEHEDPFSQIAFELKASNMLAKRLCRDDMPNMHLAYLLQVEVQVADLLAQMELVGVSYNLELLDGVKEQIQPHLEKIEKEASNIAGETFNVRSVSQLSKILYERLRAPLINNKTSTDEQRLQALQAYNDVRVSRLCKIVLEHRKASQIISKWIEADWLHKAKHLKGDEGVLQIHCCWNQTATATGRLSASNPNLQAVTKSINRFNCGVMDSSGDSIVNVNIRDAFIPKREKVFLSLDYSQIEIRILAHLSRDKHLCEILNESNAESTDLFTKLAKTWSSNIPISREQAKRVCYSIIYGTSAMQLGKQLGIEVARAHVLKKSFLSFFSGVDAFSKEVKASARSCGYVETILKRRRFLPDISSTDRSERESAERKAVNTVVQGSAADLIKCAMVRWSNLIKCNRDIVSKVKLVAQIHDELLFEVDERVEVSEMAQKLKRLMCTVFKLKVPIEVNINYGKKWGSLQEL